MKRSILYVYCRFTPNEALTIFTPQLFKNLSPANHSLLYTRAKEGNCIFIKYAQVWHFVFSNKTQK